MAWVRQKHSRRKQEACDPLDSDAFLHQVLYYLSGKPIPTMISEMHRPKTPPPKRQRLIEYPSQPQPLLEYPMPPTQHHEAKSHHHNDRASVSSSEDYGRPDRHRGDWPRKGRHRSPRQRDDYERASNRGDDYERVSNRRDSYERAYRSQHQRNEYDARSDNSWEEYGRRDHHRADRHRDDYERRDHHAGHHYARPVSPIAPVPSYTPSRSYRPPKSVSSRWSSATTPLDL